MKEPNRALPPPIDEGEFADMLKAVNRVLIKRLRPHWRAILKSYYYGGLRLGEPLDFRWNDPGYHVPNLEDPDNPVIEFSARQKNRKVQTVAIADEFADLIRGLPVTNEYVFQVIGPKVRFNQTRRMSEIIRDIAVSAKITRETASGQVFATAQHLRRSYGQRMSQIVGPATLKHLMRHSSIATTMKYYVGDDARMAALDLRRHSRT